MVDRRGLGGFEIWGLSFFGFRGFVFLVGFLGFWVWGVFCVLGFFLVVKVRVFEFFVLEWESLAREVVLGRRRGDRGRGGVCLLFGWRRGEGGKGGVLGGLRVSWNLWGFRVVSGSSGDSGGVSGRFLGRFRGRLPEGVLEKGFLPLLPGIGHSLRPLCTPWDHLEQH